jgi:Lar family restriction alleviation protein
MKKIRTIKLRPCPICGDHEAQAYIDKDALALPHQVQCINCGLMTGAFDSPEEAAQSWNKRLFEDSYRARIAELENELSEISNKWWDKQNDTR